MEGLPVSGLQGQGNIIANGLKLSSPPTLSVRTSLSQVEISKIFCGPDKIGTTPIFPAADILSLAVYLRGVFYNETWKRGHPIVGQGYAANSMVLAHLNDEWSGRVFSPFYAVSFALPGTVFDEVADDAGMRRVSNVDCEPGIVDPVVAHLVASILPAFERSNEVNALFLQYVVLALCVHLLQRYGIGSQIGVRRGGLTPFQLNRAKDLIVSNLAGAISLADVARECGLSRQYFIKAFKQSTGVPPHRWLQQHRIRIAKELLRGTTLPIVEIAFRCGFADQSHLTRVFYALTHDTPSAWRRKQRS
jgi:AraC family transcriptional regulator